MPGQNDPGNKQNQVPESEKGFEQGKDIQGQGPGTVRSDPKRDPRSTGTGTATGTAPQNPGTEPQNPSSTDKPIRNPSGEDLGQGIEGDEGPGRGVL